MLRSSKNLSSKAALDMALTTILEEENNAKAMTESSDRGELPYYENISSKVYKMVFGRLTVSELKVARLTCQKWHREIFPLLEEKSCFCFQGQDNPSEFTKARLLSTFLNVVSKDSFQWKMLKALYPKPEEALPITVLIQWSHLRIIRANYLELRQWIARGHVPNISFLQLSNARMNWSNYLLIFRELEGLSKIHDTAVCAEAGIWEEFEKGCVFNEKLTCSQTFQSNFRLNSPDILFHSKNIKEIKVRRSRIEELITFLKLFLVMECSSLERLELSAEDCLRACQKTKKKNNTRLQEPKSVLFSHLGALINKNGETLESLKVSFRHYSTLGWFEQYTSEKYEDVDGMMYKPDLRDLIIFMKHHRWHNTIKMEKLESLKLEFENKKIPTIEEIEYFTSFLCSLTKLSSLSISHFLLTSYNSLSMPLFLKRIEFLTTSNNAVQLGISLRNKDTEGLSQSYKDRDQLPSNLELFYSNLKSIIVTCHSHEMNVRQALFPWGRRLISGEENANNEEVLTSHFIEDFWVIDERPLGKSTPLFYASEVVESYPNLVTLIIRDSLSGLKCNEKDLIRWPLLDDFGMQLILENLGKLKHLDLKGNLFFLTDSGITGMSVENCEMFKEQCKDEERKWEETQTSTEGDFESAGGSIIINSVMMDEDKEKRVSFSNLKTLQFCSLEYLGPKITNISFKKGFNGMKTLKFLKLVGLIQIHPQSILTFKKKFLEESPNCRIEIIMKT